MSNAFTYKGTDVADLGVVVIGHDRWPSPEYQINAVSGASSHNSGVYQGAIRGSVSKTVRCMMSAVDESTLVDRVDTLKALLTPVEGEGYLTFDHEPNRIYYGVSVQAINPVPQGPTAVEFDVTFLIPDGRVLHVTQIVETEQTIDESPESFVTPIGDVVDGTRLALPLYTLKNTHANPVTDIDVEILQTGSHFNWSQSSAGLLQNEILRIDCARQHVERLQDSGITGTIGAEGNRLTLSASGTISSGDLITIGNEDLYVLSVSGTSATVYRARNRTIQEAQSSFMIHLRNSEMASVIGPPYDWPFLKNGVQNEITVTGFTAGLFNLVYRGEFE